MGVAGAGLCQKLELEISKMGGSGNPVCMAGLTSLLDECVVVA